MKRVYLDQNKWIDLPAAEKDVDREGRLRRLAGSIHDNAMRRRPGCLGSRA